MQEISELHRTGRPVLVGTHQRPRVGADLPAPAEGRDVPHQVLNAKNHRAEAAVIAQAGRRGAVTISTNMAGRGTDIVLGGNAECCQSDRRRRNSRRGGKRSSEEPWQKRAVCT